MSGVPSPVSQAITNASTKFAPQAGISVAEFEQLLYGIWQNESSSAYPNNYANGEGYGGLFGTAVTAPFGPASQVEAIPANKMPSVQAQANTAASILAGQISANNGNVSAALSAYSGGGYNSVSGASGSITQAPPRPSGNAQLDAWYSTPLQIGEDVIAPGLSVVDGLIGGVSDVSDALKIMAWFISPKHWVMALEAVVGIGLMFAGLVHLGGDRDESAPGLAPPLTEQKLRRFSTLVEEAPEAAAAAVA